MQMHVWAR